MKIAIHQPEHFPYMGFFMKMYQADLFIILDDVQFTKGNFQHRNRFLNESNKEEWFTIPLEKKPHHKLIKDIKTNDSIEWREKITKQLSNVFTQDLTDIYSSSNLIDINLASIKLCRKNLNINTPLMLSSELNIKTKGSQKLADICDKLEASTYISGVGAKSYLDEKVFNCKVQFIQPSPPDYYTTLQHI
jgi:hypothetical protein